MKNQIGVFSDPILVIIDTEYLKTLDERNIKSGYGEIFKHSLISGNLFEELINNVKFSVIRILLNFDKTLIVQKEKNIDDNVKEKVITKDKIGRNDPCYCGSGKKYKKWK